MQPFLSRMKSVALFVGRSSLFVLGAATLILLFVMVSVEWFLRFLPPLIFVALPDEYRRILMLMTVAPLKVKPLAAV